MTPPRLHERRRSKSESLTTPEPGRRESAEGDGSRGLVYSIFQGVRAPSRPLPGLQTTSDAPAAVQTSRGARMVVRQVPRQDCLMG